VRINNNNSLDLAAKAGETLTLTYVSGDAVVTFLGFGQQGALTPGATQPLVIPATGTDIPLLVRAVFKDANGGFASIRISDAAGNAAPFTFTQFPGVVTNAIVFLIDIE
jgi:hypothetical protein